MEIIKPKAREESLPSLFSDFFNTDRFFKPGWLDRELEKSVPAVNIKENGKQFTIELAAPGFKKEDFQVEIEDDMLTISGKMEEEKKEENDRYTRKEYGYQSFSRSFTLPANSESEKMDARYENGILKIVLPKKESARVKPKKAVKVS